MSQNSHSLTLFFDNRIQHLHFDLLLKALSKENCDDIRRWSDKLGADLEREWDEDWFNIEHRTAAGHIELNYDTSTRYHLPLEALSRLFKVGLKAAVLEVFYGQVGEYERYHFMNDAMVGRQHWRKQMPEFAPLLATTDDADAHIADVGDGAGQPLAQLIDEHHRREEQAIQTVRTLVGDRSSNSPGLLVRWWRLLKAAGRGVGHAIVFTIIALLVFKGSKLMWMGIGAVLAIILPILYAWWESRKWPDLGAASDQADEVLVVPDAPAGAASGLPQSGQPYQPKSLPRVGPPLSATHAAAIRGICQRTLAFEQTNVKQYLFTFVELSRYLTHLDKQTHGDDAQLSDDDVNEFSDLYAQQREFLRSEKMHDYFCQYYRTVLLQIQSEALLGTTILHFGEARDMSGVLIGMLDSKEAAATYANSVNSMDDFLNWKDYMLKMTATEAAAQQEAPKPHRGMLKTKVLIAVIFVVMAGALGNEEFSDYRRDAAIQRDPAVVIAKVIGHDVASSSRRGRTTDKHKISYAFEASGKRYADVLTLKNETGAQTVERGSLEVVYSKSNPNLHVTKSSYRDGRTVGGLVKSMLVMLLFSLAGAALGGGLMAWKFGWLKKTD